MSIVSGVFKCLKIKVTDFYPPTKEKLLIKPLKFAEPYTNISDEDKHIINHQQSTSMDKKRKRIIRHNYGGIRRCQGI